MPDWLDVLISAGLLENSSLVGFNDVCMLIDWFNRDELFSVRTIKNL